MEAKIDALKRSLDELGSTIRDTIAKRRATGKQIAGKINQTKELRVERNELTDAVKDLKQQRRQQNKTLKSALDKVRSMSREKTNSAGLKKKIDELEYTLETEALPYSQEQKIMKQINAVRKEFKAAEAQENVNKDRAVLKEDLTKTRGEADETHKAIQTKAQESQERHEKILKLNKEIDALKIEEAKLEKEIDERTKEEKKKKVELKKLMKEAGMEEEPDEKSQRRKLQAKKKAAETKLSKGEKLTTDDLLALQG
tara:strand:+ start:44 stop:811 length:768 start_codon:yes stop_codon:yes gene_type:complete